ncbi:MAG: alpha/beta hydrolase [Anaerolineae bacterium]|jgi:putative tributyrin esterase|nr:esterase family protein [Chloroflexota bacterium]
MARHLVHWRSALIGKITTMEVLVPQGEPPFPVVYLLHGLTGDATVWTRFQNVERLVEDRGVVLVMPSADRSFYANDPRPGGLPYLDYLTQEIRGEVERVFPVVPDRAARACVGLSMGGYGSLLASLRHPELYAVAASVSGSTYYGHDMTGRHENDDVGALGRALRRQCNDVFYLAEQLDWNVTPLALRISCGTEDHLWDTNLAFHEHLTGLGVPHEWISHAGAHDYGTWDVQVPLALDWAMRQLGA